MSCEGGAKTEEREASEGNADVRSGMNLKPPSPEVSHVHRRSLRKFAVHSNMKCLVWYFGLLLTVPLAGFSGDTQEVIVKRGEDVTLVCRAPNKAAIEQLAWSRAELKSHKYVFFLRNNRSLINSQLPSYRGRVKLMDPEMKDGNASVILKNVNINDTGTYECEIGWSSTGRALISTIKLKVQVSDGAAGIIKDKDGVIIHASIGVLLGVLFVCVIVVVFMILRRCKDPKRIYKLFVKITRCC